MGRHLLAPLVCLLAFSGFSGTASADVTLSQSNSAAAILNIELTELFGHERAAFGSLSANRLARLENAPIPRLFPDRQPKFSYTAEYLDALPSEKGDAQWRCLSEALYFEARGEAIKGQFAVAEVILNRVDSNRFPSTICRVVHQGTGRYLQCQFTYTCDGYADRIGEKVAWARAGKIASLMMIAENRPLTGGATHYHTKAVNPRWARVFPRTATIGAHHFYQQPPRAATNG